MQLRLGSAVLMLRLLCLLCCLAALQAVSIDGPTLARATVGVPFTCAIVTSGVVTAYTASGLPSGMTINPADGRITGTPTTAGTYTVNLGATGAAGATLSLTVDAAGTAAITNADQFTITQDAPCSLVLLSDAALPEFLANSLPSGMQIDATGLITGAPAVSGTANVEISADNGLTATTMVIAVTARATTAPATTLPVQPQAVAGAPFACWIHATGATAYSAAGKPAWLNLDPATGLLSGTPPAGLAGVNVRIAATAPASGGTCTSVIAIPIATPATGDPVLTSPAVILATEGSGLVWRAVSAATATWNGGGMIPSGLSLDASSGELTGVPGLGAAAGQYDILLDAINPLTSAVRTTTLALRVLPGTDLAPTITALAPPPLTVGAPAVIAMQTADGTPTAFALIDSSGTFTIDSSGLLTGTPSAAGIVTLRLTASNAVGSATTTLQTRVAAANTAGPLPTAPVQWTVSAGSAFAASMLATGSPTGWNIAGLPSDVDPDATSGRLIGRPLTPGRSNLLVSCTTGSASNQTHAVLTVADVPAGTPLIQDAGPWFLTVGQSATLQLVDSSGTSSWSANALPPGVSVSSVGVLSGLPTTVGLFQAQVVATRSGRSARTTALIVVSAAAGSAPIITGPGTMFAAADQPFNAVLTATGIPFEWTVVGRPAWLNLDPATGTLSGTPTTTDVTPPFILQIAARNGAGTANTTMVVSFGRPGGDTSSDGVSGVSGGCGAGGTALLVLALALGFRSRARRN